MLMSHKRVKEMNINVKYNYFIPHVDFELYHDIPVMCTQFSDHYSIHQWRSQGNKSHVTLSTYFGRITW